MSNGTMPPLDRHASAPEASPTRTGALLLVLLLTTPILFDGAKLCYAQWAALSGPVPSVQTPALDLAVCYIDEATSVLRRRADRPFGRTPIPPSWAVYTLVVSLGIGVLLLRHHRPR